LISRILPLAITLAIRAQHGTGGFLLLMGRMEQLCIVMVVDVKNVETPKPGDGENIEAGG